MGSLAGPVWLERSWIEACVRAAGECDRYRPEDYVRVFGGRVSTTLERLVRKRLELPPDAEDPLDDLLGAAPERVVQWMRRKAALADGSDVGLPVCDSSSVRAVLQAARTEHGAWSIRGSQKPTDGWTQAQVALARDLCAATFAEAGTLPGVSQGGAWKLYRRHAECMQSNDDYALRMADLTRAVVGSGPFGADQNR